MNILFVFGSKNISISEDPTYVRMHKLDITKDIFEEKNIFGDEIAKSFKIIEEKGRGAIVLINIFFKNVKRIIHLPRLFLNHEV